MSFFRCCERVSVSSVRSSVEVELLEELADGFGAHVGLEVLVLRAEALAFFLADELLVDEAFGGGAAGLDDDVFLEVDDLFEGADFHGQQVAHPGGHRLEEPDVADGGCEVDVAHAAAAFARVGDLHAASVADDSFVLQDAFAEEAVLFGAVGAVVDGLGLLDLAVGPRADFVGRGQRDGHGDLFIDDIGQWGCHSAIPPESGFPISDFRFPIEQQTAAANRESKIKNQKIKNRKWRLRSCVSRGACSGTGP